MLPSGSSGSGGSATNGATPVLFGYTLRCFVRTYVLRLVTLFSGKLVWPKSWLCEHIRFVMPTSKF